MKAMMLLDDALPWVARGITPPNLKSDYSGAQTVTVPKTAALEPSDRELSENVLVDMDILLMVESSSFDNRYKGVWYLVHRVPAAAQARVCYDGGGCFKVCQDSTKSPSPCTSSGRC